MCYSFLAVLEDTVSNTDIRQTLLFVLAWSWGYCINDLSDALINCFLFLDTLEDSVSNTDVRCWLFLSDREDTVSNADVRYTSLFVFHWSWEYCKNAGLTHAQTYIDTIRVIHAPEIELPARRGLIHCMTKWTHTLPPPHSIRLTPPAGSYPSSLHRKGSQDVWSRVILKRDGVDTQSLTPAGSSLGLCLPKTFNRPQFFF